MTDHTFPIDLDALEAAALAADHDGRRWTTTEGTVGGPGVGGYPQRIHRAGDTVLVAECYEGQETYPAVFAPHIVAFDPPTALALIRRLRAVEQLAADWDANGNSRPLGDPTADTWHTAARQIRRVVRGEP